MSNETIFREVDEALRGDRLRAVWRRFGPFVIGGAIAVVLLVAANEGWAWWQNSNAARSSDRFYAALELAEAGDVAGAQTALNEVVAEGTGDYPLLARFRQASLLARDGKRAEAIAAYDALATAETNPRLREVALILAAYLAVDDGDVDAVQLRVGPMATAEHRMRNAAREAIGLTQFKAGDLDAARATIQEILVDPLATQEFRQRAQVYLVQLVALGAKGPEDEVAAAEAPQPADTPAADAPAATDPSVGDALELDVTAPATDAAPAAEEAAPAADAAPAAGPAADTAPAMAPAAEPAPAATPAATPEAAAPTAREKGAADAAAALAAPAN